VEVAILCLSRFFNNFMLLFLEVYSSKNKSRTVELRIRLKVIRILFIYHIPLKSYINFLKFISDCFFLHILVFERWETAIAKREQNSRVFNVAL